MRHVALRGRTVAVLWFGLAGLLATACHSTPPPPPTGDYTEDGYRVNYLKTVRHEGCEYVLWYNGEGSDMLHKANCDNPVHRQ
ncbi:hypothetical protein SAMN05421823_101335 [Catalinimonas alkaloidigena]|uniref:Uncharacterized protein n=1 Tax=Catalinimonas alkaloidigena TaxID=1075417 RepID=A0A1G8XDI1_9BACT|nr:hypothetical protein [Catalinimonas alkaloidigena]SDJ88553.1 hypothetical protein SAMN05421823_101335 [Catalinimonas alkaloidigena]